MDHSCMGVLKFIELEKEYTGHFTLNFDFFIDFVATYILTLRLVIESYKLEHELLQNKIDILFC